MDYFSILNLNKEPFSNSPDPDYFFHSQQHVGCLQKLELSLRLRRGLNVVIGDVGTGKTTLCRQLIRKFKDDTEIETHLILDPYFSTPHEFLLNVAEMLGSEKPDKNDDDYQLKEQIKQMLFQKGVDEKKTIVLIIDEGQKIPEFCLELLREFLNYETNDYKLLQIAIFAQKEFEKTLELHANFTDRINLYHRLEPMNFRDTRRMIQFRLNQSSGEVQKLALFTYPALWAIYRTTRGYPRKIVNICHRSILSMIIQNKTKANWFLVQSCMKRAFEGTRKRSWVLATISVLIVAAGIVFIPRFIPERISMSETGKSESSGIRTAKKSAAVSEKTAIPERSGAAHAGKTQAEESVQVRDTFSEAVITKPVSTGTGQTYAQTEPDAAPVTSAGNDTAINHQTPPKVLGQLRVRRTETLGGMIQKIYGIFNPQYLYAIIEMNPHIADPNTIDVGEVIVFPAIPLNIKPHKQKRWWVELNRRENIETVFNILRQNRELASSCRLIPFWNKSSGLHFSIVLHPYYYDEASAVDMLSSLSSEIGSEGKLLASWDDETLFYANPYLGP